MLKDVISEDEFDKLPESTQMRYLYCATCDVYYLATNRYQHIHVKGGAEL